MNSPHIVVVQHAGSIGPLDNCFFHVLSRLLCAASGYVYVKVTEYGLLPLSYNPIGLLASLSDEMSHNISIISVIWPTQTNVSLLTDERRLGLTCRHSHNVTSWVGTWYNRLGLALEPTLALTQMECALEIGSKIFHLLTTWCFS